MWYLTFGTTNGLKKRLHNAFIFYVQDAISSLHFNQDVSRYTLVNLMAYLTALSDTPPSQPVGPPAPPILLTRDLALWDAFFRKLKTHSEVLRDKKSVIALFQLLLTLFQYTIDCTVSQYCVGREGGSRLLCCSFQLGV